MNMHDIQTHINMYIYANVEILIQSTKLHHHSLANYKEKSRVEYEAHDFL